MVSNSSAKRQRGAAPDKGGQEPYTVDNQVGFLLRLAYQRHNANLTRRLGPFALTPPQAVVLVRLLERGSCSQNLLGRLVAMEPANIHDVVRRLKDRGLIQQCKDPGDGRLLLLSLTKEGLSLARDLIAVSIDSVADTVKGLNATERATLRALLKKIVAD